MCRRYVSTSLKLAITEPDCAILARTTRHHIAATGHPLTFENTCITDRRRRCAGTLLVGRAGITRVIHREHWPPSAAFCDIGCHVTRIGNAENQRRSQLDEFEILSITDQRHRTLRLILQHLPGFGRTDLTGKAEMDDPAAITGRHLADDGFNAN